jgi:hypothetical protein
VTGTGKTEAYNSKGYAVKSLRNFKRSDLKHYEVGLASLAMWFVLFWPGHISKMFVDMQHRFMGASSDWLARAEKADEAGQFLILVIPSFLTGFAAVFIGVFLVISYLLLIPVGAGRILWIAHKNFRGTLPEDRASSSGRSAP